MISYNRYGYTEEQNETSNSGTGLTPEQESILNNLANIPNGNEAQKLLTLDPTGDLGAIDPINEWTSDVTRHRAINVIDNRYIPFAYPNGLNISEDGAIFSVSNNNIAMAILPYPCKGNTNIQFEVSFGSITSSNQSGIHVGIIDPSLLRSESVGDINNWILEPNLYKNTGMLLTLEYHSNTNKHIYNGNAYTTVTPIDYRASSVTDMTKGSRILLGLQSSGVEVVYVNSEHITLARHRVTNTINNLNEKYFFIAFGTNSATFKICTSYESITYTGISSPMNNFVDKTVRHDVILPTSNKQGAGTIVAPINLEDSFSVWTNNNITPGNKNGVFGTNTYMVSSGLWNSMAVVPFQMTNTKYFEFIINSGTNSNHGTWIGFIDQIAFEGIPDASQWAITNNSITTGGASLSFDGSPNGRVNGSSITVAVHTPSQRDIMPNDVLQFGVKDNVIEMTVYDDASKAIIYNISYANVGNFNFSGTIYPAIATNHIISFSHRLSPDIYRGTQISDLQYVSATINPSSYAQYHESQRGKLFYDDSMKRSLVVNDNTISHVTTIKEVSVLPVFNKQQHLGLFYLANGSLFVGGNNKFILIS